ncbi:MAG TPA: GNAT family N-acetyltransferase, partial [Candidatus Saccharimonadales bacterium]|nr:GNAT family N-acetyltransferase [Candidatus Saccharimonadales bacterium]
DAAGDWQAAAPLARVVVDAGRLTHGLFRSVIGTVRRARPGFLNTALLLCGAPLSVANPPARIAAGGDPGAAWRALGGVLREVADAEGAAWRAFKEFAPRELAPARAALAPGGWIVAPSETSWVMDLPWRAYSAYLGGLRSPYRYKIRTAERALRAGGVSVDLAPLAGAYDPDLHRLYEAVVDRAAVQLERLTPEFFRAFGRAHGDAAQLLRFTRGGRVIGWVALLFHGGVAYDLFHGIDYAENEAVALYFNQLAGVVRAAIGRGAARLSLGQSTGVAKSRFGARPEPRWIALRHKSAAVTAVLRAAETRLFPEPREPARRVFAGGAPPCAPWW